MREQIGAGRPVESHVRVAVRLKNGNRLSGVVKDGKLVERVDGLRFVDAQARDNGAGIRLWYSGNGRNYVFVPFADFAEYEVLQRLTGKQLAELEREMQQEEKRGAPVTQKSDAEVAGSAEGQVGGSAAEKPAVPDVEGAPAPVSGAPDAVGSANGDAAALAQQRQWNALLLAYPPKDGWSKQKRDEIARRFVVVGAKPSETEQQFVDQFAEWEKACAHFGVELKAAEPAGGSATGRRKSKTASNQPEAEPTTEAGTTEPSTGKSKRRKQ